MKFIKNRKVAAGITCIIVLMSILIGGHSSLTRLRIEVLNQFYYGDEYTGKGIQGDLKYMVGQCYNLTVVAQRYIDKDDEKIKEVIKYRDLFQGALTPEEEVGTSTKAIEAAMKLYETMGTIELEQRDQYYRDSFAVNIESRRLIISHSGYNEKGLLFNQNLDRFPANVLSKITVIKPLVLYE